MKNLWLWIYVYIYLCLQNKLPGGSLYNPPAPPVFLALPREENTDIEDWEILMSVGRNRYRQPLDAGKLQFLQFHAWSEADNEFRQEYLILI